jgi:signal transduction histidine kinase
MDHCSEADMHARERCLEAHIRAEARLIASLAHKINNPLAYTVNYLFVLDRSLRDDASRDLARKIRQGLGKATDILNGLVDAANVPAASPARMDVRAVIEGCIASYPAGTTLVVTNSVERGATVLANADRVLAVIRAFLDNALDAGARHAIVTCGDRGGHPCIAVSDDGEGVAPENAERVFDPCFSTRNNRAGTGLYAAYHAALSFGGHIGYEPNTPGGSIFSLYCPREAARAEG